MFHLIFTSAVVSQDRPNLYFRNISEKDGLSSNNVSAIAEDKNGFIWIGGNKGLDKYNGTKFTHYKKGNPAIEILDNVVHDLYIDSNNTMFVEHLNGFTATNLDNNFKTFYKGDKYNYDIDVNFKKEERKNNSQIKDHSLNKNNQNISNAKNVNVKQSNLGLGYIINIFFLFFIA